MIKLELFEGQSDKEIMEQFKAEPDQMKGVTILYAYYTYEDYSGDATVIFLKDGRLFEVHDSHCSCYGLGEGGWNPEETTVENFIHYINRGAQPMGVDYQMVVDLLKELTEANDITLQRDLMLQLEMLTKVH